MPVQKLIIQCQKESTSEITAKFDLSVKMSYFIYRSTFVQFLIFNA